MKPKGAVPPTVSTSLTATSDGTHRLDVRVDASTIVNGPGLRAMAMPASRRRTLAKIPTPSTSPFRPHHLAQAFSPRRIRPPKRPRVLLDGEALEPLIITPPYDGRRVYRDTAYPWTCMGRIHGPGSKTSGVMIGPRHVLTASHVVDWNDPGPMYFAANQFDGTLTEASLVDRAMTYNKIASVNSQNIEFDYAVLRLEQDIGNTHTGWLGARSYDSDWDGLVAWAAVGYEFGTNRPMYQDDFFLYQHDSGPSAALKSNSMDAQPGMSGGPVFGWWSALPYAIGVISSEALGFNWVAGGRTMVDLIRAARDEWP
jgi:V8-like Glu-specific endopeptidase